MPELQQKPQPSFYSSGLRTKMLWPAPDDRGWVNDLVHHYRLNDKIISTYLAKKWGNYDFRIQVIEPSLQTSEMHTTDPDAAQR